MSALGQKRTFETQFTGDGTSALTQIAVERANDGVIIVTGDRVN